MVQPTDYRMQYVDPAQAMTQGLQGAQTMQMKRQSMQISDQAIQENQYKLAEMQRQQQQALARKEAYDARRTELLDGANETTYLRNTLRLRSEFPEFNAGADEAIKQMGDARRQQTYQTAQQVRALLTAKKPEAARELLQSQAVAMRNSGDEQSAKVTEALAQAMTEAPDLAPRIADEFAALTMTAEDRDKMLKAGSEIEENRATATKTLAESAEVAANAANERAARLANIEARIEQNRIAQLRANTAAAQVEIARQNTALRAEAQALVREQWNERMSTLPANLQPKMTEYVEGALSNASLANRAESIAAKLSAFGLKPEGGDGRQYRTIAEWMKQSSGNQDAYTLARQEVQTYNVAAIGEALKDYKPASNSDLQMIQAAFPSPNDPPEYLARYMANMAKLSRMSSVVSESSAEWLEANRGMGMSKQPVKIMGATIPAGVTYPEFRAKYLPAIVDSRMGQGAAPAGQKTTAPTASYMQLVNKPQ